MGRNNEIPSFVFVFLKNKNNNDDVTLELAFGSRGTVVDVMTSYDQFGLDDLEIESRQGKKFFLSLDRPD
jgi:hypothetical protein